nr:hypothetical protein [Gammaproteobacteria bacterium]
ITVTFPATDDAPALSSSIVRNIMLVDDPANSEFDISALPTALTINEQDVVSSADNSFTLDGFSININALAKDADEFVPVGDKRRVVTPTLILESVALANNATGSLSPTLDKTNVIEIVKTNGIFTLVVQDPDFIESALFGNLAVNLQGDTTAPATQVIPISIAIDVTQAADKSVTYANTARDSATPPVYALTYTQTAYASAVTNSTGIDATTITAIDASTNFIFSAIAAGGVPTEYINITETNEVYRTVDLGDRGNFIARDLMQTEAFASLGSNADLTRDAGRSIIVNFASNANLADGVEIFKANPTTGNLERADAEFNAYFDLEVNNTDASKHINITQRVFINPNNPSISYNALDTIQLYRGTRDEYTFNYFIRARAATDGFTNASNYALAQFSVVVEASEINSRTQILQVALVPDGGGLDHPNKIVLLDENTLNGATIDLNQIAVNSFSGVDDYDLLVEFNNPDAALNNEIASAITITLPQGNAPDADIASSLAKDGGLIDIQLSSENREPSAATSVRTITDTPAVSGATFLENEQRYTRRYDFALAQNLYGTANIIISVQDQGKEANSNLGRPSMQVITLRVNGPSNGVDEENQVFTYAATIGGMELGALQEDAGVLNVAGEITVDLNVDSVDLNQGGIQEQIIGDHELVGLVSANDPAVSTNFLQNGLDKNFIAIDSSTTGADTITYLQHGWGVQAIEAQFIINEPRGFGGTSSTLRTHTQEFPVVVESMVDPTIVSNSQLPGFDSDDFGTLDNLLMGTNTQSGTITFADGDLYFDTLASALGTGVTVTSIAPSVITQTLVFNNPITINLVDTNGDAVATDAGMTNLAQVNLDYSLTLDTASLNALLGRFVTNFPLDVSFINGAGSDINNNQFNVAFTLNNQPTEVLQAALVPNNGDISSPGKIILFDANISSGATIDLNQIGVNSFSGADAYDLLIEFNNPDAASKNEVASKIVITLPQGNAPDTDIASSLASDGGLVDIQLSSE